MPTYALEYADWSSLEGDYVTDIPVSIQGRPSRWNSLDEIYSWAQANASTEILMVRNLHTDATAVLAKGQPLKDHDAARVSRALQTI